MAEMHFISTAELLQLQEHVVQLGGAIDWNACGAWVVDTGGGVLGCCVAVYVKRE